VPCDPTYGSNLPNSTTVQHHGAACELARAGRDTIAFNFSPERA
jgi:hypothetical protein